MTTQNQQQETGRFKTPPFRVSFPQVFVPKAVVAGQEAKYSLSMLFPKVYTQELLNKLGPIMPGNRAMTVDEANKMMESLKAAVAGAAAAKWGADRSKWPTKKETIDGQVVERSAIVSPWHDGAEKDYDGYSKDIVFATASSKIKPGLVDIKMQGIQSPEEFYGGCWAWATVTVFAYDNKKMGVSFGLRNVQKLRDDERFGGGAAPDKDFTPIEVSAGAAAAAPAQAGANGAAKDPLGI